MIDRYTQGFQSWCQTVKRNGRFIPPIRSFTIFATTVKPKQLWLGILVVRPQFLSNSGQRF